MVRSAIPAVVIVLFVPLSVHAQFAVIDPANVARNTVTAALKEYLVTSQRLQREQLERMARRLSRLTSLTKYALPGAPPWRIHAFDDPTVSAMARDFQAALNYGDRAGRALLAVSHDVQAATGLLHGLSPGAARAVASRLATLDAAAAAMIAGTHQSGETRLNGRRELAAVEALEGDVVDPSAEQSATAALEKISGAGLIAGRQRQARVQLLASVLEELLIATKRTRDADAAVLNMQLTTWRDGAAANQAFAAGTGDALRAWRQP
ncbi:MAG: hypothetical protein R2745_02075 [Vicinamibacterales bacterium]